MAFKDSKLGKFYHKRKKWIIGGGLYTLFGFKGGFLASLWIIPTYAVMMRSCPSPEHKMIEHPYSDTVVIEKVKMKKDDRVKIEAYYANKRGKEKIKPYFIEPNGDGKIYKMDHEDISDVLHEHTVGDSVAVEGYISRRFIKYITNIDAIIDEKEK